MEPAPLAGFGALYDLRADRLTPSQFEVAVTADRRTATFSFTGLILDRADALRRGWDIHAQLMLPGRYFQEFTTIS